MSAIVIHWVNKQGGYSHSALLLNHLENDQSLYISVYLDTKDRQYRFATQSFEQDKEKNNVTAYVVIPTCEDGNKFGLAEAVIAKYWQEIFALKKTSHERFIQEMTAPSADEKAASADQNEENSKQTGQTNALVTLSAEYKKFVSHSVFSPGSTLDCSGFVARLLQKGGLELFLTHKEAKALTTFIGVPQLQEIAQQAVKGIMAAQTEKTVCKDPHLTIKSSASWAEMRQFRM